MTFKITTNVTNIFVPKKDLLCEDEKWHPCAFLSKGLNNVKRNYDVHDKEMLGIIRALET